MGVVDESDQALAVDQFVADFGVYVDTQTAALFVGSGMSARASYPDWDGLVQPYHDALGIDLDDQPLLVQYYQDSAPGRADDVRQDIIKMVRSVDAEATDSHRRILGLPIPDVWTTNYDRLLELTAEGMGLDATVYDEDAQLAELLPSPKRLYKMHGTVGDTTVSPKLVISRDDFERYPATHPRFWQLLRANFLTRSFLFVGFSLTDPNISEIFKLARLDTPDATRKHYALFGPPKEEKRRLSELRLRDLARVGVSVVALQSHDELDAVLGRLAARCRPPRAYISGSAEEGHPNPEQAHAIAAELGRQLSAHPDVLLMAGGVLGAVVGYEVSRARLADNTYRPGDATVIRRVSSDELKPPNDRLGNMVFDGEKADGLRSKAFEQVRAVVAIGGEKRTRAEIAQAKELGMGVIAVGASGGAAAEQWALDVADDNYRLGERAVDRAEVKRLNGTDPAEVAASCLRLLRQALYLD